MAAIDPNSAEFGECVADALEHLWDAGYLGKLSPLTELQSVKRRVPRRREVSHVDQGRAVREGLCAAIENLKSRQDPPDRSAENHYYLVLHRIYIEGAKRSVVASELGMTERNLRRHLTKAIRAVAEVLCDWERQMGP